MKYVKNNEWLLKNFNEMNVRIVDCRFSLAEPEKGRLDYLSGHVPGAVFFDLERDLSSPVGEHGGRHPLPDIADLAEKLRKAGIGTDTTVIAYDNGEGSFAARFWWLLHYLGHDHVYVLDGGYKGWLQDNNPITVVIPAFEKGNLHVNLRPELLADVEEVKIAVEKQNKILIDSREEKRYLGLEEPIDKKAGHIPSAINKPWMKGLTNNQYLPIDEQKQRFSDINPDSEIIVYCGSGVTAVPNFLTLKEAGFEKVKLYVGSFSDWISYKENKIE
ncbi:rhodanese [Neobacillus bataviensis LMG 21833]|uniref:Rhodanese n=1 Tax=Neobacillus bataviensis LMG 21833 TaxID=1117379 RepID=K6DN02_9BACI|nr:sulfurtransferase [Neobacillus bataviensis]EKN69538.1 rhodanese [Neobacillus bataviensis LMG 21833]